MPVSRTRGTKDSVKFMQVLDRAVYLRLKQLAIQRGVTVQELIRVLLIPDWLHGAEERRLKSELESRHRRSTQKRLFRTSLQKPLVAARKN
ncbi:hypothetical protein E6H32_07250 [Candidatus Bathyarchaeota archaeon]|nr:MAG: hypothetical protein E6H32_07250 [Candidatus Bathyarchaeota archaeon]